MVAGISPKPDLEVEFGHIVSKNIAKNCVKVGFLKIHENHVSNFTEPQDGPRKKWSEQHL